MPERRRAEAVFRHHPDYQAAIGSESITHRKLMASSGV